MIRCLGQSQKHKEQRTAEASHRNWMRLRGRLLQKKSCGVNAESVNTGRSRAGILCFGTKSINTILFSIEMQCWSDELAKLPRVAVFAARGFPKGGGALINLGNPHLSTCPSTDLKQRSRHVHGENTVCPLSSQCSCRSSTSPLALWTRPTTDPYPTFAPFGLPATQRQSRP